MLGKLCMDAKDSTRARGGLSAWLLVLTCSVLAGCGFHSLYGGAEATQFDETLASVAVNPISERIGQRVANSLRDALNPTGEKIPKRYTSFQLYATNNSAPIFYGSTRSQRSYEIGESPYSVLVANTNAQTRAAEAISAEIRDRLMVFFHRQGAKS